jgi:hypothetical protein
VSDLDAGVTAKHVFVFSAFVFSAASGRGQSSIFRRRTRFRLVRSVVRLLGNLYRDISDTWAKHVHSHGRVYFIGQSDAEIDDLHENSLRQKLPERAAEDRK